MADDYVSFRLTVLRKEDFARKGCGPGSPQVKGLVTAGNLDYLTLVVVVQKVCKDCRDGS